MKSKLLLLALASALLIGCASELVINNKYNFNKYNKISLAVCPVQQSSNLDLDSMLSIVFYDTITNYRTIGPLHVREICKLNQEFNNAIIKLENINISKIDSLNDDLGKYLSEMEQNVIKSNLNKTNLLLVPAKFRLREISGLCVGSTTFLLIDLFSKKLVYLKNQSLNIDPNGGIRSGGEISKRDGNEINNQMRRQVFMCTVFLAAEARSDFQTMFKLKQ